MAQLSYEDFSKKLREICERGKARCADPEYQRNRDAIESRIARYDHAQMKYTRKQRNIPESFWPILDNPGDTKALGDVKDWLHGGKLFGVFAGEKGLGKSLALAYAIDQHGGYYAEAIQAVRVGLFDDDWDKLSVPVFLALDELGMEPRDDKGWIESRFYRLMSWRYQTNRRTLLATNLGYEAFRTRYGTGPLERFWDRLTSDCDIFHYVGPSMRQEAITQ